MVRSTCEAGEQGRGNGCGVGGGKAPSQGNTDGEARPGRRAGNGVSRSWNVCERLLVEISRCGSPP